MKKYIIIIPILLVFYFVTLNYRINKSKDELSSKLVSNVDVLEDNVFKDVEKEPRSALVSYNGEELNMSLEEYIIGVVACEVPASFEIETLKAMSVVARSFYLYKDNSLEKYIASTNDQCFNDKNLMMEKWGSEYERYYEIIKNAVMETEGEFVTYNDNIAQTFYFSISNGMTETSGNVFSEDKPYLVSVNSSWDKNVSNYEKLVSFSKEEFLSKLGLEVSEEISINILSRTLSGRVENIEVNGNNFKGTEFRKILGIRSTDFDINIDKDVLITTRGYGHGVGMSQYGANEMAKLGYTYKDIIKYYYKGVEISKL